MMMCDYDYKWTVLSRNTTKSHVDEEATIKWMKHPLSHILFVLNNNNNIFVVVNVTVVVHSFNFIFKFIFTN